MWLADRFGYSGPAAGALEFYRTLPPEQQRIFAREVYFDELKAGGREYNNPESRRFQSYLRGRQASAALFPDAAEGERSDDISITVSGNPFDPGYGIRTLGGGDIQLLTPGGRTVIGPEGVVPGSGAGVITQEDGDIEIYSQDSVLLGLSRIMTTYGGDILIWSAEGDINAGRGAKGTIVFTPPRVLYDPLGNIRLAPQAPSSGAGIATLDPIPGIPPGDIDLIAPLGTIDAGEAGIRVSGNINLAALKVVNAANIDVQGDSTGIPAAAAVNTGALTAASSAATSTLNEAARMAERARPQPVREMPTILNVRFLGFGPAE